MQLQRVGSVYRHHQNYSVLIDQQCTWNNFPCVRGLQQRRIRNADLSCRTMEDDGFLYARKNKMYDNRKRSAIAPRDSSLETFKQGYDSMDTPHAPHQNQNSGALDQSVDWYQDNNGSFDQDVASLSDGNSMNNTQLSFSANSTNNNNGMTPKSMYETLRINPNGGTRRVYVRRRDLVRQYKLQPRDLRRMDPSVSAGSRTAPSVTVKENCILVNVCGVKAIIDAEKCILFEADAAWSSKFQELLIPGLQQAAERALIAQRVGRKRKANGYGSDGTSTDFEPERSLPFELQVLEAALTIATGRIDDELDVASRRVMSTLQRLPTAVTPLNLEELRKVKQILVQLEDRAEALRDMLEELMDKEEEMVELNLSSRPVREERRRHRERERLEREASVLTAKLLERGRSEGSSLTENSGATSTSTSSSLPYTAAGITNQILTDPVYDALPQNKEDSREEDAQESYQDALEELEDDDAEEEELEEIEDLLEYYLQRAATTQSTAERLLAETRDLEESIGVSLSARRFEVNRLELLLSIASFAAALGAMVASIFGMNLRSTLEMSVVGFWGTTLCIIVGCAWVFWILYKYTKSKRIL